MIEGTRTANTKRKITKFLFIMSCTIHVSSYLSFQIKGKNPIEIPVTQHKQISLAMFLFVLGFGCGEFRV